MNENIDLTKILKDCPKGWKLYSHLYGTVPFYCIEHGDVLVKVGKGGYVHFTRDGRVSCLPDSGCCLFPSKEQRDWSKFTAPWYKKERFDPKTLKSFDKILARDREGTRWRCTFFSHIRDKEETIFKYVTTNDCYKRCIPYNEDTKHLVGTTDEAPEYYKYWED